MRDRQYPRRNAVSEPVCDCWWNRGPVINIPFQPTRPHNRLLKYLTPNRAIRDTNKQNNLFYKPAVRMFKKVTYSLGHGLKPLKSFRNLCTNIQQPRIQ
jgi:hypothetical protein